MIIASYICLLPQPIETVNCIEKYRFIETGANKWRNGFTEIRKLGKDRYAIRSNMANTYSVSNIEEMESYCKYYLRLNGY